MAGALTIAFLLAVVGFASGWGIASYRARQFSRRPIPSLYVQGISHLLGERNDEAIQTFIEVLRQHPESFELLLALGRLFRRRGELDRALSIHQHLLEQPNADLIAREEILLEIGRDYLKAGILNRAESILLDLLARNPHSIAGLESLAEVYELGADWPQAIRCRRELLERGVPNQDAIIAMLYGELAESALVQGNMDTAEMYVQEAIASYPSSPRVAVIRGKIAHQQGDWERAARSWSALSVPAAGGVISLILKDYLQSLSRCQHLPECRRWREQFLAQVGQGSLLPRLVDALRETDGDEMARSYLLERLRWERGLPLLQLYFRVGGEPGAVLEAIPDSLLALPAPLPTLRCTHCGYQTTEFYWRCPSCRRWGSFVEGDLAK
ncbi:MAG: tetratricopeptide repeat protein [Acidithiobacillus sp.]|nr:tetratricopeptide repeat protein [Acidithiobacillus sp.]